MRIHRIKLTNYGGVGACEVTLDDEGVTIIEGQNEVGKTSLLEAVDLIIDYPDSSGAGPVKAIKPVDRDDGAEAEIEVSTGPYRFTYRKRWHRQRLTELRIVEPRQEQLTGREAHDRVKVMLEETLDEALWEALRLHQGGQLAQGAFGEGESLGRALDQTAGGEVGDGRENDLWSRVQDERAKYWTATGLPKGNLTTIEADLAASRSRVDELLAELRALDADAEAVARLSDNATLLEERARDSEAEEKRLQACEEAIDRYRSEVRRLEVEREALAAKHELRAGAAARRSDLIARVDELTTAADAADDELERAGPVRRAAEAHDAQVHAELEQARRLLETAEVDHRQADADETFRRQEIELAQLSERHDRIVEAQERLSRAEAVLDATLVDDALLDRIAAANLELVGAEAAAASGAVTVEALALSEVELQIDGSPRALTEGETTETVVIDSASIVIEDLVRLDVRAGSEAQNLAERVAGATASLAALCEQAGVSDVDAAQAANRARQDAERTKDEASATIQQDLRDLTLESLAQKISRLTERTSSYEANRTHPSEVPADFEAAKALAAKREGALTESRETVGRLEQEARTAASALSEAEVGDATLTEKARQSRGALGLAERELEAARADTADSTLDDDAARAKADLDDTETALDEARRELEAHDPESVAALIENAVAARQRAARELRDNRKEAERLRTMLEVKGEEGLGRDLNEARTSRDRLEREYERTRARADAVALLHEVLDEHRTAARQRYVQPFKEGIEQLGRIVFGESLEVELGDDLRIARRTLHGITLDFDQLSDGAQEQLGLIGRLACATIVSPDGGAPVVFDDALGWTDPTRLDRMGAAIRSAGQSCQIIVLTCTPGRYGNVGTARVVQLSG